MTAKTLFIVLDAADHRLMRSLAQKGLLPQIEAVRRSSAMSAVSRPEELTDDAVWATFQYARGLGEHGRYFWKRELIDGSATHFASAGEDHLKPWWEPLAESGARVAIFDLPKLRPGPIPDGIFLGNWLVHGQYGPEIVSFPKNAASAIEKHAGPHTFKKQNEAPFGQSIDAKVKAALPQLRAKPWDLFAISFKEIHALSHLAWSGCHGNLGAHQGASSLARAFIAVDSAIGSLREAAGPKCNVFIFSTSGMGNNRSVDHHADDIVQYFNRRLGQKYPLHARFGHGRDKFVRKIRFTENVFALRIHRRTGLSHRLLVDGVADELGELRVGDTGRKVFCDIIRMARRYPGARQRELPDLIGVLPDRLGQPREICSPKMGRLINEPARIRPGNHSGDGFLI